MRIAILFHFLDELEPAAVTEVEGAVTDVLLPLLGDTVCHRNAEGMRFRAHVIGRHFDYSLADGEGIDGSITVTLSLDRMISQEQGASAAALIQRRQ
jgi:hypothetical protein